MTPNEIILARYRKIGTLEFDAGQWYYYDEDDRTWQLVPGLTAEPDVPELDEDVSLGLSAFYNQ